MRREICRWLSSARAGFSPYIEENPPDTVIFDVRGLESLYGPPAKLAREIGRRIGVPASIAIASNPDAAMHAAHGMRGVTVIAAGREAEVLAPLSVNLLGMTGMTAATAELLDLWGIRSFGELAKLPPLGVAARLGEEGVYLQRLARGEGHRQLRPIVRSAGVRRGDGTRRSGGIDRGFVVYSVETAERRLRAAGRAGAGDE